MHTCLHQGKQDTSSTNMMNSKYHSSSGPVKKVHVNEEEKIPK